MKRSRLDFGKRCRRHRKVRYLSRKEAERVVERLRRSAVLEYARAYFEPRCQCWHLTTQRPGTPPRRST